MYLPAAYLSGIDDQQLGGFFKSLERSVRKVVNRDPVFRAVKKLDLQIKKEVARSKIAQGVIYGAGAIAAPFTGGLSLAAAAAAVQASKAAKAGRSFGAQILQGAGAGSIGWVAGVGLVYGAGAAGIGPGTLTGPGGFFSTGAGAASAAASDAGMLYAPVSSAPIITPAGAALSPAASAAASDAGMLYAPTEAVSAGTTVAAPSVGTTIASGLKTAAGALKDTFGIMALVRGMGAPSPQPGATDTGPGGTFGPSPGGYYSSGGDNSGGGGIGPSGGGAFMQPGDAGAPAPGSPLMQGNTPYYIAGGIALAVAVAMSKGRKRRGARA